MNVEWKRRSALSKWRKYFFLLKVSMAVVSIGSPAWIIILFLITPRLALPRQWRNSFS
jgi:hypothetical protein